MWNGTRACVCVWGARVRLGGREKGASAQTCLGRGGTLWEQPAALGDVIGPGGGERPGHVRPWHLSALLSFRLDGPLPSGVRVDGDSLGFPPLTAEHSGIYVCHVSNQLSSRDSQVTVEVLGKHRGRHRTLGWWGQTELGRGGLRVGATGHPPQTAALFTGPEEAPGTQVDLVSASVLVVGIIAALLLCLLVAVVLLMARYHRRKTQQMTQK